jgi:hypothetical protein
VIVLKAGETMNLRLITPGEALIMNDGVMFASLRALTGRAESAIGRVRSDASVSDVRDTSRCWVNWCR